MLGAANGLTNKSVARNPLRNSATSSVTTLEVDEPPVVKKSLETQLFQAISKSHIEEIHHILENSELKINMQDNPIDHSTPLMRALQKKLPEDTIRLFLDKGANPVLINSKGRSALHLACLSYSPALIESLIDKGANPKSTDHEGRSALHYASKASSFETFQVIADRLEPAELLEYDYRWKSPFHYAVNNEEHAAKIFTYITNKCEPADIRIFMQETNNIQLLKELPDYLLAILRSTQPAEPEKYFCKEKGLEKIEFKEGTANDVSKINAKDRGDKDKLMLWNHNLIEYGLSKADLDEREFKEAYERSKECFKSGTFARGSKSTGLIGVNKDHAKDWKAPEGYVIKTKINGKYASVGDIRIFGRNVELDDGKECFLFDLVLLHPD